MLECSLLLKPHSVFSPSLGLRPNLVFKLKLGPKPNLLFKCILAPRPSLEPNCLMVSNDPKGNLNLPHTKIINDHRLTLIKIFSSHMLLLWVRLVISGMQGVKSRVNHLVIAITPMEKIPANKTLTGQLHPDKINGGNQELDGTLVLSLICGLRCPSTLNYPFWQHWNCWMCPNWPIILSFIICNLYWPQVPTKIPGDCPKFDGKAGEDPQAHVMTYHLWCSSNSWLDDSI